MIKISEKTGKYVVVGYKKAFMPVTDKALEILNCERYQDVSSILSVYCLLYTSNTE